MGTFEGRGGQRWTGMCGCGALADLGNLELATGRPGAVGTPRESAWNSLEGRPDRLGCWRFWSSPPAIGFQGALALLACRRTGSRVDGMSAGCGKRFLENGIMWDSAPRRGSLALRGQQCHLGQNASRAWLHHRAESSRRAPRRRRRPHGLDCAGPPLAGCRYRGGGPLAAASSLHSGSTV